MGFACVLALAEEGFVVLLKALDLRIASLLPLDDGLGWLWDVLVELGCLLLLPFNFGMRPLGSIDLRGSSAKLLVLPATFGMRPNCDADVDGEAVAAGTGRPSRSARRRSRSSCRRCLSSSSRRSLVVSRRSGSWRFFADAAVGTALIVGTGSCCF